MLYASIKSRARFWWYKPPALLTYAVAVLSVGAALIIGWKIEASWQSVPHVSLFLCAVILSASFGGFRPGLLAGILSVLAFDYYFVPPIHSFVPHAQEVPRLLFFALAAFIVGSLSAAQSRATESLRAARDDLRRTVEELERSNEALQKENTERMQAEDALRIAQSELARVSRLTTLGEMTTSIAHEINQPLGAVVNNASACLRWLAANDVEEARHSAEMIRADGERAGEIIKRVRALATKAPPQKDSLDINQTILEVLELARSEAQKNRVSLQTQLARGLPPVTGDRIQLQQVILNLIVNAIEAMSEVKDHARELLIVSKKDEASGVRISVSDSGPGLDVESLDRIFTAFYTTKPQGIGMGLAICRSIVEVHGGRLWAAANHGAGATFQFTLPGDGP